MEINNFIEQLNEEEKKLLETIAAIRKLKEYYNPLSSNPFIVTAESTEKKNTIPEKYSSDLTWPDKILFSLSTIKKGNTIAVANALVGLDKEITFEKAKSKSSEHLSKLGQDKVIVKRKIKGKLGNEYWIK